MYAMVKILFALVCVCCLRKPCTNRMCSVEGRRETFRLRAQIHNLHTRHRSVCTRPHSLLLYTNPCNASHSITTYTSNNFINYAGKPTPYSIMNAKIFLPNYLVNPRRLNSTEKQYLHRVHSTTSQPDPLSHHPLLLLPLPLPPQHPSHPPPNPPTSPTSPTSTTSPPSSTTTRSQPITVRSRCAIVTTVHDRSLMTSWSMASVA